MRPHTFLCSLAVSSLITPTIGAPTPATQSSYESSDSGSHIQKRQEASTLLKIIVAITAGFTSGFVWSGTDDALKRTFGNRKRTDGENELLNAYEACIVSANRLEDVRATARNEFQIRQAHEEFERAVGVFSSASTAMAALGKRIVMLPDPESRCTLSSVQHITLPIEPPHRDVFKREVIPTNRDSASHPTPGVQPSQEQKRLADRTASFIIATIPQGSTRLFDHPAIKKFVAPEYTEIINSLSVEAQLVLLPNFCLGLIMRGVIIPIDSVPSGLNRRGLTEKVVKAAASPLDTLAWKTAEFWKASGMEVLKNFGLGAAFGVVIGVIMKAVGDEDDAAVTASNLAASDTSAEATDSDVTTSDIPTDDDIVPTVSGSIPKQLHNVYAQTAPEKRQLLEFPSEEVQAELLQLYAAHPELFNGEISLHATDLSRRAPLSIPAEIWKAAIGSVGFAGGGYAIYRIVSDHASLKKWMKPMVRRDLDFAREDHRPFERRVSISKGAVAAAIAGIGAMFGGSMFYDHFFKQKAPEATSEESSGGLPTEPNSLNELD